MGRPGKIITPYSEILARVEESIDKREKKHKIDNRIGLKE